MTDGTRSGVHLVLRARRAFVDGALRPAVVAVADGRIAAVLPIDAVVDAARVVDVPDDRVLLPGLVDSHVHINDPGRADWEGFPTATRAAAAAGVTTLVDMPLNSVPVTTTPEALAAKRAAADGRISVDVGFWGGAVPEALGRMSALHDAGVVGFKCFLSPSGIDEFGHLDRAQLLAALAELGGLGSRLIVHAEDPAELRDPGDDDGALGPHYADFLASRPPASEEHAIAAVIEGVRRTGARAHIVHLSDAASLPMLRAAIAEGLPISVETCPHYLSITAEEIPDGATEFKCCPPIRGAANRDALWEGVLDGTISLVVSDHSPSTVELKRAHGGDFGLSWGGIAGLQLGFAAVWTEAIARGVGLETLLPRFTTGPADLVGFADVGRIAPGAQADFAVLAPEERRIVDAHALEHRNPISAYHGRELAGVVHETWLRGERIFSLDGGHAASSGRLR